MEYVANWILKRTSRSFTGYTAYNPGSFCLVTVDYLWWENHCFSRKIKIVVVLEYMGYWVWKMTPRPFTGYISYKHGIFSLVTVKIIFFSRKIKIWKRTPGPFQLVLEYIANLIWKRTQRPFTGYISQWDDFCWEN